MLDRKLAVFLPRAWADIGWKEIRVALVGGIALLVFLVVLDGDSQVFHQGDKGPNWPWVAIQLVKYQIWTFSLMLALVIADSAADDGASRWIAYSVAIVPGCIIGIVLSTLWLVVLSWFNEGPPVPAAWSKVLRGAGYNLSTWLKLGGGIGFLYAEMRHTRQTRMRLARAELDRATKARQALESRLQAMQARVEPQFLFDTLAQVKHLYDAAPVRAARVLDSLITYLRAAMPRMRDSASTVAQEIDLARSYLDIVLAESRTISPAVEMDPRIGDARMPPMMLLPLIDYSLACCNSEARVRDIRLKVIEDAAMIHIGVHTTAAAIQQPASDDRIRTLHERLVALYGTGARLTTKATPDELDIRLELPREDRKPVTGDAHDAPRAGIATMQEAPA